MTRLFESVFAVSSIRGGDAFAANKPHSTINPVEVHNIATNDTFQQQKVDIATFQKEVLNLSHTSWQGPLLPTFIQTFRRRF
jgi:hypothetical protein